MRGLLVFLGVTLFALQARAAPAKPFGVTPPPTWASPVATDVSAPPAANTTAGREYLLLEKQLRLGDHTEDAYVHVAHRIVSSVGLQSSSQLEIEFDASYQSLDLHSIVVRRDGTALDRLVPADVKVVEREPNLERQVYDGRKTAVVFLSDLRVGDVVDYAYTIHGADPTLEGKFATMLPLGAPEPVHRLRIRVLVPEGRTLHVATHGDTGQADPTLEPAVQRAAGVMEYSWDRSDLPAYSTEPDAPAWYRPFPWVELSEFSSWREVDDWGLRLFYGSTPLSTSAQDLIARWRKEDPTDEGLLLRAIRFVQDEVRYLGIEVGLGRRHPSDPSTVFERRYGDCKDKSALLVAILHAAGLSAQPALASLTEGAVLSQRQPTPLAFDHVIVRVGPLRGTVYYVDATVSDQGGGLARLAYSDLSQALVLEEGGNQLESLPRDPSREPDRVVTEHFSPPQPQDDAEGQLEVVRVYRAQMADLMRSMLKSLNAEQTSKMFLRTYVNEFPSIHERAPLDSFDDRVKDELRVIGHYALPKFWTWHEDRQRYSVLLDPRALEDYIQRPPNAPRRAPIAIPFPARVHYVTDIALPMAVKDESPDVALAGPAFHFTFHAAQRATSIVYTYDLETRSEVVWPAEFAEHFAATDKARATLPRVLLLPRGGSSGPNWYAWLVLACTTPLWIWGSLRAYRFTPRERPVVDDGLPKAPVGIGGWLNLVAFQLLVTPPVLCVYMRNLGSILSRQQWINLTTASAKGVRFAYIGLVELPVELGLLVYSIVVAMVFFRKKRSFRVLYVAFMALALLFAVGDRTAVWATGDPKSIPEGQFVGRLVLDAALAFYVLRSRRVTATFVR